MRLIALFLSIWISYSPLRASTCIDLFYNTISKTNWNNAITRIRNIYQENTYVLTNSKGKELLVLFESAQTHQKTGEAARFLIEEVVDLKINGLEILSSSLAREPMPLAEMNARNISRPPSKEEISYERFKPVRLELKNQKRTLKVMASIASAIPSTLLGLGALYLNIPGKEALVPLAFAGTAFVSTILHRGLDRAHRVKLEELKAKFEEISLNEIQAYDTLQTIYHYMKSASPQTVLILPEKFKSDFLIFAELEGRFEIQGAPYHQN